jgi:hypothetical protein
MKMCSKNGFTRPSGAASQKRAPIRRGGITPTNQGPFQARGEPTSFRSPFRARLKLK